jgi:hypothetical protein
MRVPTHVDTKTGAVWYEDQGEPPRGGAFKLVNLDRRFKGELELVQLIPLTYQTVATGELVGVEFDPRLQAGTIEVLEDYVPGKDDGMIATGNARGRVSWGSKEFHATRGWVKGQEVKRGEVDPLRSLLDG